MSGTSKLTHGSPVGIGDGYNVFEKSGKNKILDYVSEPRGDQSINTRISYCKTQQEVFDAIGVDVTVGVSAGGAGISNRTSFAKSVRTTSTSLTVLVVSTRITGGEKVTRVTGLNSEAKLKGTAQELYNYGGDSYVSFVERGAQFIAAYEFQASSREEQQKIENDTKAEIPVGSDATVNASVAVAIENMIKSSGESYSYSCLGIGWSNAPLPEGPNAPTWSLQTFPKINLQDGGSVVRFETASYSTTGLVTDWESVDYWRTKYTEPWAGSSALCNWEIALARCVQIQEEVLALYSFYFAMGADPDLGTYMAKTNRFNDNIQAWLRQVAANPWDPTIQMYNITQEDVEGCSVPTPNFQIIRSPTVMGGKGGEVFSSTKFNRQWILNRAYLSQIDFRVWECLNAYKLVYSFDAKPTARPVISEYKGYDNVGKTWVSRSLGPQSKIADIRGTKCNFKEKKEWALVRSLQFAIQGGQGVYSFDPVSGNLSSIPLNNNAGMPADLAEKGALVDFEIAAGKYIDSVRPVWVKFGPCDWTYAASEMPH